MKKFIKKQSHIYNCNIIVQAFSMKKPPLTTALNFLFSNTEFCVPR